MFIAENVRKSYGSLEVLKGIDLHIKHKEVVVLVGASGLGKSTFLRCFNVLEEINGGEILIKGERVDPNNTNLSSLRAKIGMAFQHFNLFPH